MIQAVSDAQAGLDRAKGQLLSALANVPDDRVAWSPSPSARTPAQIVAHCAMAIQNMHDMMKGIEFPIVSTAEADRHFLEWEKSFQTRDAAVDEFVRSADAFHGWLGGLAESQLTEMRKLPFGLGEAPIGIFMGFPAMHTTFHAAQIEYIQTIYGDRDWHL